MHDVLCEEGMNWPGTLVLPAALLGHDPEAYGHSTGHNIAKHGACAASSFALYTVTDPKNAPHKRAMVFCRTVDALAGVDSVAVGLAPGTQWCRCHYAIQYARSATLGGEGGKNQVKRLHIAVAEYITHTCIS